MPPKHCCFIFEMICCFSAFISTISLAALEVCWRGKIPPHHPSPSCPAFYIRTPTSISREKRKGTCPLFSHQYQDKKIKKLTGDYFIRRWGRGGLTLVYTIHLQFPIVYWSGIQLFPQGAGAATPGLGGSLGASASGSNPSEQGLNIQNLQSILQNMGFSPQEQVQ